MILRLFLLYQLTTNEDTSVTSMVIATDIDGNPLTYSLQNAPVNGIVNVSLDGMYTYTPNADFNGIDQFTVLVSDGQGRHSHLHNYNYDSASK
ncbi:cadherin-like domain-containing protein [Priestia sp. 40]|uniref:cadherin-like domain-containing protein n=1 Tax=Priestia sp. 40 TaxID=3394459 RepID=UPI003BF671A7